MKFVLITGCSEGGIGFALAHEFHKKGFQVFATARTTSKMAALEGIPGIQLLPLDVTSLSDIQTTVHYVQAATGGKLDVLVNNSGQQIVGPVLELERQAAREMFEVNFWAVFDMIQAFSACLREAKGTIVNVSSINSYLYPPFMGVYGASKAALTIFGETLRLEMLPLEIRVLNVVTGAIDTRIMKNGPVPKLDSSLPYARAREDIVKLASGTDGTKRMKAEEYAEKVVQDVIRGTTGKVWRGESATATRLVSLWMPTWLLDKILAMKTGLAKLL